MLYDMKSKKFRELGPILRDQPNTLIDAQGRGTAITEDYQVARYDPATDSLTCPAGRKLLRNGDNDRDQAHRYRAEDCRGCSLHHC